MKDKIKLLIARIDAFSLRERGLLLLSVVFVLYSVWNGFLMGPLTAHHKQAQTQLKQLQSATATLAEQSIAISKRQTQDPDAATRLELAAVQTQIDALEQRIKERTQDLIDPATMASLLKDILKDEPGLTLISVNSIPPRGLLDNVTQAPDDPTRTNLGVAAIYQHGMTLVFEGRYLDGLAYFRKLESLPWRLYWDGIELKVTKYPIARFTINVHTISLREGWIGV